MKPSTKHFLFLSSLYLCSTVAFAEAGGGVGHRVKNVDMSATNDKNLPASVKVLKLGLPPQYGGCSIHVDEQLMGLAENVDNDRTAVRELAQIAKAVLNISEQSEQNAFIPRSFSKSSSALVKNAVVKLATKAYENSKTKNNIILRFHLDVRARNEVLAEILDNISIQASIWTEDLDRLRSKLPRKDTCPAVQEI